MAGIRKVVGMTKRSKKRFEAKQIVVLLGSLAHNLIVWSRRWLSATVAKLRECDDSAS